ncbi:MAG: WG repeat-containing protein, partial [Bacteroidales bacterium]|nr:WG repeat-containing protein [Bacteroidales bacterium]
ETRYLMMADSNGNYVQSGPELSAITCFEDGTGNKALYRTAESKKVGMLNEKGEELLPPVFDGLNYLSFSADDASCYEARMIDGTGTNRYGVIDEYGKNIVPCIYDKVEPVQNGKYGIRVQQNGKMGWYGTDGQEIMPTGFDDLYMDHFWDGSKHRAYLRGSYIDDHGERYTALFDTAGRRLTDYVTGYVSDDVIHDRAAELEEYRIY